MAYDPEEKAKRMTWFNTEATVTHEGKEYGLTFDEIAKVHSRSNDWHYEGDPSSWLTTAIVRKVKSKFKGKVPRTKLIALAAAILKKTPEKIESTLDWNANYLAFHGGYTPDEIHVYRKDEK